MKISIVTPTFNRKHFLPDTIKSVLASKLEPFTDIEWEYVVYDDGSVDGTKELFGPNSSARVRYIRTDKNRGQGYAKNEAVKQAKGDYVLFLDSDDILVSRALYNFVSFARRNPDAGWFVSDFLRVDSELKYIIGGDYYGWDFSGPKEMLEAIFSGNHFIQGNVFFKKQLFLDAGGFDPELRMAEDLDLYVRFLLKVGLPVRCNFISHLHRNHSDNISKGVTLEKHKIDAENLRRKYSKSV